MRTSLKRSNDLEKLIQIIRESWDCLAKNIAKGRIKREYIDEETIESELFCHLRCNGLQVGRQYVTRLRKGTIKTPTGLAIIDIIASLPNKPYTVGIELKWPHNSMVTEYRKKILQDIENLKAYIDNRLIDVGFCLAYTTDRNYMSDDRSGVKINHTGYDTYWQSFNNETDCFLTIVVDK